MGKILSIDYGDRRIGLAISDEMKLLARGLPTVDCNKEGIFKRLRQLLDEHNIEKIIIGMPYNMDGTIGGQGEKVKHFIEKLKEQIDLPVETLDERLTTISAERIMRDLGIKQKGNKAKKDELAARIILQSYLDSQI